MRHSMFAFAVAGAACVLAADARAQDAQEPVRTIAHVRGNLYELQDGEQHTVLLTTSGGIVLVDPLNLPAARWLQEALSERFPDPTVRYVIYTSHRGRRAAGASVFDATAEIVAHEEFNSRLRGTRGRAPGYYTNVRFAERGYRTARTISLGGTRAALMHPGDALGAATTIVHFPDERVVFAGEYPAMLSTRAAPFEPLVPHKVIEWVHAVDALEFDLLLTGDGRRFTKENVEAVRAYVEALDAEVKAGFGRGQALRQIQSELESTPDTGVPSPAGRAAQASEVYARLRLLRISVSAGAFANAINRNAFFCQSPGLAYCTASGGGSPARVLGVEMALGRLGWGVEARVAPRFSGSVGAEFFDSTTERSETMISLLARYGVLERRQISLALGGGWSSIRGQLHFTRDLRDIFGPIPDPYSTSDHGTGAIGVTGTADLTLWMTNQLALVVPVRITAASRDHTEYWMSRWDLHAGVALRAAILRRVISR